MTHRHKVTVTAKVEALSQVALAAAGTTAGRSPLVVVSRILDTLVGLRSDPHIPADRIRLTDRTAAAMAVADEAVSVSINSVSLFQNFDALRL